jgi:hypothetical protein
MLENVAYCAVFYKTTSTTKLPVLCQNVGV